MFLGACRAGCFLAGPGQIGIRGSLIALRLAMNTDKRPIAARSEPPFITPIRVQNVALSVLATLALLVLLRYAQELFVPLVLSILIAFALNPFVTLLETLHVHRTLAAAIVVAFLIVSTGFGAYALRYQANVVLENVPGTLGRLRTQIERFRASSPQSSGPIGKIQKAAQEIEKTAAEATETRPEKGVTKVEIAQPPFRANEYLWSGSIGLLGLLSDSVLVAFLVFFLLASGDLTKRKLVQIIGTKLSEKKMTLETLNEITAQIERFLLIQAVTCVAVGACVGFTLWAFGVNQPAFWGAVAGVLSSVPYLGPTFVTVALGLVTFLQFDSIAVAAEIVGITVVIFSLEGFLVKPTVMGKAANINGLAMFIGLLFWSWIWGLIGMIVAVPIMMVIKSVCDRVENFRPIGELLDEK
jgi:predicted PurR-regulated permease PerM